MIILVSKAKGTFSRSPQDPKHIISKSDQWGRRPIDIACQHGNLEVVKYLINQGCEVRTRLRGEIQDYQIPLLNSARWNHYYVVEYLLCCKSRYKIKELKLALKLTTSRLIGDLVHDYIKMNGMSRSKCCGRFGGIRKSSKVKPVLWKGSARTET